MRKRDLEQGTRLFVFDFFFDQARLAWPRQAGRWGGRPAWRLGPAASAPRVPKLDKILYIL